MTSIDDELDRKLSDGSISLEDADAIQTFAAFLEECGPSRNSPDFDPKRFRDAWKKYYPEDYAEAVNMLK